MNTHDKLELPPLPDLPAYSPEVFDREVKVVSETMAEQLMHDYARAAIEADRKLRTPPNEPFAIVVDRMYEGEGPSLAYWNGENYQFSDGDCHNREGDTLDGYTAEFLTDHQLEKRLFDDRKRIASALEARFIVADARSDPTKADYAYYVGAADAYDIAEQIVKGERDE